MKKDILAVFGIILLIAAVINGTNIQSVDEYYLTHIDDITPESETVIISIRCGTVLDNYDDLDPALKSEEFVPADGVILPPTEYVLRPGTPCLTFLTVRYVTTGFRWNIWAPIKTATAACIFREYTIFTSFPADLFRGGCTVLTENSRTSAARNTD